MILKVNDSSNIGFKKLTDADLGTGTSHQTHIGLYEEVTDYIANDSMLSSILIYDSSLVELPCFFDFIESTTTEDVQRSPKIRKGDVQSVTSKIREIVQSNSNQSDWYLLWFGLKSNEILFFLVRGGSSDATKLNEILGSLKNKKITKEESNFDRIIKYIDDRYITLTYDSDIIDIETNEFERRELEQKRTFQKVNNVSTKKYNLVLPKRNLQEISETISKIGRNGELIISKYLQSLKDRREIENFTWMNKNSESYSPYDFEIEKLDKSKLYVDVKSTPSSHEKEVFFSKSELEFINREPSYSVYRIYNILNAPMLKKCDNSSTLLKIIQQDVESLKERLERKNVKLVQLNISAKITNDSDEEISLSEFVCA